jgi:hypothetical protein
MEVFNSLREDFRVEQSLTYVFSRQKLRFRVVYRQLTMYGKGRNILCTKTARHLVQTKTKNCPPT